LLGTETWHFPMRVTGFAECDVTGPDRSRIMWRDLLEILEEPHPPVRAGTVVREFVVDIAEQGTGSGVPSDG
jgi:hypothetical protein